MNGDPAVCVAGVGTVKLFSVDPFTVKVLELAAVTFAVVSLALSV